MLSLVAWLRGLSAFASICIGFVASRWGLAITWMSTYKSVSVMSLGTRRAETNPSSFTPFHHVSRRFSGRTGRTECANWLWAGLFILHLDFLCVFAMIRVGIDVVQIHVFTFAWLMLFVEVLLKWRFIWCLKVFECLSKWGLAGEPLRQVFHSVMELWEVMWSSKREMDQNTENAVLGHYTKARV